MRCSFLPIMQSFFHEKKRGLSLLIEEAANPKGFLFSEFGITSSTKLLPKPSRILFGRVSKKGRSGRFLELFRQFATEQKFTITLEKRWQLNITCSASVSVFNFFRVQSSKTLLACSFLVLRKERPVILKGPSPHRNRNVSLGQRQMLWEYSHNRSASSALLSSPKLSRFVMLFGF